MAKFKYILCRAAIVDEYYEVEADSEQEALELAYDGNLGNPYNSEFIDWRDEEYQICDSEPIEPLYQMVKDYKCATTS